MAIRTFKEIIDNKGYRISSKDREIFEEGTLQSFFGFSDSDMIEFILYDVNDNQLPQGEFGESVRYVPLNSENIKDYFLIADGTEFQAFKFPSEYFIDVERLIKEGGYNNGIFKTQITLLNKRVGYNSPNEKLWISEISPSRTEVRLLPISNKVSKQTDLFDRFNIMVNENSNFRDDITPFIGNFINTINPSDVSSFIKNTYGESYYNEFISEFGINGLDILATKIHMSFTQAMGYEFSNRVSSISSPNYGKEKKSKPSIKFSKEDVYFVAQRILIEVIDKFLPNRTIQSSTNVQTELDASMDDVGRILQRRESDVVIRPKKVEVEVTREKKKEVQESQKISKEIIKEVPAELPIPKFTKPNPIKRRKRRSIFGRRNRTRNNRRNSNRSYGDRPGIS